MDHPVLHPQLTPQKGLNTPYDDVFKSILKKCPRIALFLINEMFYKQGLIDEEYDGSEHIELLDKALPDLEFGNLEMDLRLVVYKKTRKTYHLECQSTSDGTIILRCIRYNTRAALEEAKYSSSRIRMKIDDSGIIFLRSTRNTPDRMTVQLDVPQGQSVSYQIPVIRIQDYSLEHMIENRLYILLPFLFFNFEKQLEKAPRDRILYDRIHETYDTILDRLRQLSDSETITAYEASTLYDALKIVFKSLGKTNKAEKEVADIMGGKVLEFSADKFFYAGKAEGKEEGRKEGKVEGIIEGTANGEQKLSDLINHLIKDGRSDDIAKVTSDKAYRDSMYKKYAIV